MTRGMRIYLACILAVNLAAAGLIIYAFFSMTITPRFGC